MAKERPAVNAAVEVFLGENFIFDTWPTLLVPAKELARDLLAEKAKANVCIILKCLELPLNSHVRHHLTGGEVMPNQLLRASDNLAVLVDDDASVEAATLLSLICAMAIGVHGSRINAAVSLNGLHSSVAKHIARDALTIVDAARNRVAPFSALLRNMVPTAEIPTAADEARLWVPVITSAVTGRLKSIRNFIAAGVIA